MTESPRADLNKDPKEIASMFDSLASRYDVMDALMTGGLDRVWMTALRKAVAPHPGERILDLAAGTGASSAALAKGGAEVVAITDSRMSPLYQAAQASLLVRSDMISFVDSMAAPLSLLNALILAVANKKGADISATFSELEHIWERFDIFGKIEDE